MNLKRLLTLSALALAMSLGLGNRAQAAFALTTSVSGVTVDGSAATTTPIAPGASITVNGVSNPVIAANGGTQFSDGVSTIFLLNDSQTLNTTGATNEQVFVSTPTGLTDNHLFNFVVNIAVNGTPTFSETFSGYQNLIGGGQFTVLSLNPNASIVPSSGGGITALVGAATSGNANSSQNPSVSAVFTVPEPASLAILGLGLLGVGGFSLRRRIGA